MKAVVFKSATLAALVVVAVVGTQAQQGRGLGPQAPPDIVGK